MATDQLDNFLNASWPQPDHRPTSQGNTVASIGKLVTEGRLGIAANLVRGDAKVLDMDNALLASLKAKHPPGVAKPFGPTAGPIPGLSHSEDDILTAIHSFKPYTAHGFSGWTVPLLKIAIKGPKVVAMLTCLTGMIGQGTAPGRSMLAASRLTLLEKKDGGHRPIDVGDLIYRLCTKVLLRHHFKADCLLPTQFGVGSKGGVEPGVRTVQRALDDSLGRSFSTLTMLDFTNAFNTADRIDIAASLREFCPSLYRTAKWAYNAASDLVLGQHILQSATGVRQGDPLGPLLLSLAIRPLLDRLSTFLGTDHLVLAYLDDVYVLSPTQDLASASEFASTLEKIYFRTSTPYSFSGSVFNKTSAIFRGLSRITP